MRFNIQPASNPADRRDVIQLEQDVFGHEKGLRLPEITVARGRAMLQFIAREENGRPAGVLTALETTGDDFIHRKYGVVSPASGRIARLTRLAVARQYRGYGLPLRLILATHACFVVPNRIGFTWLLFDAARASSSMISSVLGFVPGTRVVRSEYGLARILSRDEQSEAAEVGRQRGWAYIAAFDAVPNSVSAGRFAPLNVPGDAVLVESRQAA